jgi:hypothetical protein
MAFLFDSSTGTSLIVRQYLDRCRQVLRRELSEKIGDLLSTDADAAATAAADDNVGEDDDDTRKGAKAKTMVKELPTSLAPTTADASKDAIQLSKSL